ncbi:MAG: hypothetical protein HQL20_06580 [Candidatus Omnitrophica bacterium]|nr:hypothetical protein [Candidatus Omnitrophota bacterium]
MNEIMCPHCRKVVYDEEALLCHFCGNSLNRTSNGLLGGMRGAGNKWIWVTIAVLVAVAIILSR